MLFSRRRCAFMPPVFLAAHSKPKSNHLSKANGSGARARCRKMLRRYNEFFKSLMRLSDLLFVSFAWWLAYGLRFHSTLFGTPENHVVRHYVVAWLIIVLVWAAVFEALDFYRPRRLSTHWREIFDLLKC